jgi:hypothetical protein
MQVSHTTLDKPTVSTDERQQQQLQQRAVDCMLTGAVHQTLAHLNPHHSNSSRGSSLNNVFSLSSFKAHRVQLRYIALLVLAGAHAVPQGGPEPPL